jgi:co-chaperonin GroES (HSP10)
VDKEAYDLLIRVLEYECDMLSKGTDTVCLDIQNLFLYVELLPAERERQTASGIHLPDQWWSRQDSTALVLGVGNGLSLDGGGIVPPMCEPGDLILIEYGDFRQVEKAREGHGERGFVWEPSIIGWLDTENDRPIPANEWCLIRLDEKPEKVGGIHLSHKAERPRSGIILECGPGRLLTRRGDHRGRRLTVDDICGDVVGRRVHWGREADVICAGRTSLQWVLVRASDLITVQGEHNGREDVRVLLR